MICLCFETADTAICTPPYAAQDDQKRELPMYKSTGLASLLRQLALPSCLYAVDGWPELTPELNPAASGDQG